MSRIVRLLMTRAVVRSTSSAALVSAIRRRLAITTIIAMVILVAGLLPPVKPASAALTVTLDPDSGPPASEVAATASAWAPGDLVDLTWNVRSMGEFTVDDSGDILFDVPDAAPDGNATIQFEVVDTGASDSAEFIVTDAAAPDTTIDSGPPDLDSHRTGTFEFSSDDPDATFLCSARTPGGVVDDFDCDSPLRYRVTVDGRFTFRVKAVDVDGNEDPTPARQSWTVDTRAPNTTILSGPTGTVGSSTARFTFRSTESGSTFRCRLDANSWQSCSSPKTFRNLSDGRHTFQVRARDRTGNTDLTPARRTWEVDD